MYLLEGNMGAGKSTLLMLIKQHLPHLEVVTEPVTSWHDSNHGQSLLGHFYQDTPRWAYTMETFTLITRVKEHLKEQQDTVSQKIMERSIYSGYYCFAKNCYKQGNMSDIEWDAYNAWFTFLVQKKCNNPFGFIYLYTTPEICLERMNRRKRPGEDIVPLSYLQELHDAHEDFLMHKQDIFPHLQEVPVLRLDVSKEFVQDSTEALRITQAIEKFINKTRQIASSKIPVAQQNDPAYF